MRWGDLLFLSGRAAVDPRDFRLLARDFRSQAEIVCDEIVEVLDASGSGLEHVLRLECFLADRADFAAWNEVFVNRFPNPRPARTTLISAFALEGMLIEIQATAGIPS